MRVSTKTERELCLPMASMYQVELDIKNVFWSYGTLHPNHRTEWWVILDSDSNYRFYEFTVDNSTQTVHCTQTFASRKSSDVEMFMKKTCRMAYVLYMCQTR